MKTRWIAGSILTLELLLTPFAVRAAPPVNVQIEVNFLLGYIDGSGCDFYRNGSWYDSEKAQAHLRSKYNYLAARNQILATEDFIEKAATESSFSGQAYELRCKDGIRVKSNPWLRGILERFRKFQ